MKTRNRRYPRSSGMNGDKSGESGAFLFSRHVPDFSDGRRSFPTNENSNLYRRGRLRLSAMDFAHYQSPKLLGSSPPITYKHGVVTGLSKIWDRPLASIRYIGKIWDSRQKVKSPNVWDFPDIWKPGLNTKTDPRISLQSSLNYVCFQNFSYTGKPSFKKNPTPKYPSHT